MKILFAAIFGFILCIKINAQTPIGGKTTDTCSNTLRYYANYWKIDSLGKNGFRELFANTILKNCNCKGSKWNSIADFLGKPNFIFAKTDEVTYRFQLNRYSDDYKQIGTQFLDIVVNKEGIIISFEVWEV